MAFTGDPYRTLGLQPGAPADEVKRAYRALAKRYHPDSGGEAALQRFLAVQAAYDMLTGPGTSAAGGRPGGTGGVGARGGPGPHGSGNARRASEAEEDRVRATRDAYRTRRSRTGAPEPDSTGPGGPAGPARPAGPTRPVGSARPAGPAHPPGTGRSSAGGESRRRRSPRVATLGSTSYDDAPHEPEPEWAGATWYGDSSGTYWTINPKEFADPRKHGPEYLARARRGGQPGAAAGFEPGAADAPIAESTADAEPQAGASAEAAPGFAADSAPPERAGSGQSGPRARRGSRQASADIPSDGQDAATPSMGRTDASRAWTRAAIAQDAAGQPAGNGGFGRVATPRNRRLVIALIGWPPLGLAAGLLINEATGCGRYAASCTGSASLLGWLAQPVIIALLLLLPRAARPAAVASAITGIAAIGGGVALSAIGGTRAPAGTAPGLLVAILVVAYVLGLAGALSGRVLLPAWLRRTD